MNQSNFDKELAELYQQRKQQVQAPKINLPKDNVKSKWRFKKPSLFMVGSLSAFGLMAFVHHFYAPKPQKVVPVQEAKYILSVTELAEPEDNSIIVKQPLPPKPTSQVPESTILDKPPAVTSLQTEINLPQTSDYSLDLPNLKLVAKEIKPSLKVMPKYSIYDLNGVENAQIELSYQVNSKGETQGITVVNSTANRKLQKAAIKALSQWRYPVSDVASQDQAFTVIFDFSATED